MLFRSNDGWKLIDWWGNSELGLKCWFKQFGGRSVSIGVGDFHSVSYGGTRNDEAICGTRWHYGKIISEQDMMDFVDANNGKHTPYPLAPDNTGNGGTPWIKLLKTPCSASDKATMICL